MIASITHEDWSPNFISTWQNSTTTTSLGGIGYSGQNDCSLSTGLTKPSRSSRKSSSHSKMLHRNGLNNRHAKNPDQKEMTKAENGNITSISKHNIFIGNIVKKSKGNRRLNQKNLSYHEASIPEQNKVEEKRVILGEGLYYQLLLFLLHLF